MAGHDAPRLTVGRVGFAQWASGLGDAVLAPARGILILCIGGGYERSFEPIAAQTA